MNEPEFVRTLKRPPIEVTNRTHPDDLARDLEERIRALLEVYDCSPTAGGWRDLALKLALDYEPAFKVMTPVDRIPGAPGGAPPGERFWDYFAMSVMVDEHKISDREAARRRAKETGKDERALANTLSAGRAGRLKRPVWWDRPSWMRKVEQALQAAVRSIEGTS